MGVWLFVLYALAVCRATGLITADVITEPLRMGVLRRLAPAATRSVQIATGATVPIGGSPDQDDIIDYLHDEHRARWVVAKLLTCPWCCSIWVAAATAPLVLLYGATPWLLGVALVGAFSQIAGMLSNLGRD